MRRSRLLLLLACLFVAMIGFGITLPVLPFYAERLVLRGRSSPADVALQVGLLTAVYPLLQLLFAPLWGHWSDSVGRKRLVLVGIAGAAVAQALFAFADSLPALYGARVLGGLLSSALFPAAAGYVADATPEAQRGRGMAWMGTAISLGVVVGPALGGILARTGWQLELSTGRVVVSSFAVPFLAAAVLAALAFVAALAWLPESPVTAADGGRATSLVVAWRAPEGRPLRALLGLAIAGQFGLALFEATFALYAKRMWNFGPSEVGTAFMVCGLVMAIAQTGTAAMFARRVRELPQIAAGFGLVGASLALLPVARATPTVLLIVGTLALGIAFIVPNLTALISTYGGGRTGSALGVQSSANSIGQLGGTLLGAVLLGWQMEAPYFVSAAILFLTGAVVGWQARRGARAPAPTATPPALRDRTEAS